ncbi:DNA polymerase III subunit beta [Bradyrhizobium elkanii]|uniref:DNA polymerase III subunit beta n=1 Tax=Bradyrhizobium elkanii TaxID=29448 RepID=UPI0035155D29
MNRTEFDTASLRKALALVSPAVAKASTLPILSSIRVRTGSIIASDLTMQVTAAVNGKGDAIDICLPADKLRAAAGLVSEKITLDIEGQFCTIKAGKSRFKVPYLPGADFPAIEETEPEAEFETTAAMHAAIGRVIYSAAVGDVRFYLNGVFLEGRDGVLTATATDGNGAATIRLGSNPKSFGAILHTATAELLSKAAPGTLGISRNTLVLQSDEARIVAKNVDGNFPDWRRIMPNQTPNSITVPRAALIQAVGLSKLARDSKKTRPIRLRAAQGVLTVTAIGLGGEQIESELPIDAEAGDPMDVGVNGDLFEPMLKTASEQQVTISWQDRNCPLFTESGPLRAVLMPLRI